MLAFASILARELRCLTLRRSIVLHCFVDKKKELFGGAVTNKARRWLVRFGFCLHVGCIVAATLAQSCSCGARPTQSRFCSATHSSGLMPMKPPSVLHAIIHVPSCQFYEQFLMPLFLLVRNLDLDASGSLSRVSLMAEARPNRMARSIFLVKT